MAPHAHVHGRQSELAGWGVFNVVEDLIDHQILGIHHVRDDLGAPPGWDVAFLAFGVMLVLVGAALARSGERHVRNQRLEQAAQASAT